MIIEEAKRRLEKGVVPPWSITDVSDPTLRPRAHGAVALKSLLDFFDPAATPTVEEFTKRCLAHPGYNPTPAGLMAMAQLHGFHAQAFDWSEKRSRRALIMLQHVIRKTPLIVWLYSHPMTVTGIGNNSIRYHDPAMPDQCDVRKTIGLDSFRAHWNRQGLVVKRKK